MSKVYLYARKNEVFWGNGTGLKLSCGKKAPGDNKAKQWSDCLHKGYSQFKVNIQEGVAGKESKES